MTRASDDRLDGRHKEFTRMSLKPGIGADAMWQVASDMMKHRLEDRGDVPFALRHGRRELPLGRYLRNKLRSYVDLPQGAPRSALDQQFQKLLPVLLLARTLPQSIGQTLTEVNTQKIRNMEAKYTIHKPKKGL